MPENSKTPSRKSGRKRRLLRRAIIGVGVLILLAILLVLLAPTIATSRWAENKIASIASKRVGRPVELSGLEFGWKTDLRLEHLAVLPANGEPAHPALVVEDVHLPLTLLDILKGLPFPATAHVARLEANLVRLDDGGWNWQRIASSASSGKPKEPKPPSEPSPLPISSLNFQIDQVDLRVIDEEKKLAAGWENGSIEAFWTGGASPLTMDLAGDLRVNDNRMPWDVRAKLTDWVNADNFLTTGTAHLVTSSDGMIAEHQISDGGFYINAGAVASQENIIRIVLPLQRLRDLGAKPEVEGELDLSLHFTHEQEFKRWNIDLSLVGTAVSGIVPGEQQYEIPPQDIRLNLTADLDLARKHLASLNFEAQSDFMTAGAQVAEMDFDEPLAAEQLNFTLDANLGDASFLAARVIGTASEPPVEGTLAIRGQKTSTTDAVPAFNINLDFQPIVLRTLEPFAANPEFLAEPLDLRPLALIAVIDASHDRSTSTTTVAVREWRSDLIDELQLDAVVSTQPLVWQATIAAALDLGDPFNTYGPRFAPPNIEEVAGNLAINLEASQDASASYLARGELQLDQLFLNMEGFNAPVREEALQLRFDVAAQPSERRYEWANLELRTSFLDAATSGTYAGNIDVNLAARANIARALLFASSWLDQPIESDGDIELKFNAAGEMNNQLDSAFELVSDGPITYTLPGRVNFAGPITLLGEAAVEYIENRPARGTIAITQMQLGDILDSTFEAAFDLNGEEPTEGQLTATFDFGSALAALDPTVMQSRGADATIEGTANLELAFNGLLQRDESGKFAYPEPWQANGSIITEIPAVEWAFNELDGYVENFADDREFTLVFAPDNRTSPTYTDNAMTGFDTVNGPRNIMLGGFIMESAIEADPANEIRFTIAEALLEETSLEGGTLALSIPTLLLGGEFVADMKQSLLTINGAHALIEGAASFETNSTFAWVDKTWSTNTNLAITDLGSALTLIDMGEESAGWLRTLAGSITLDAQFEGTVPGEQASFLDGLPLRGELAFNAEGVGLEIPRRLSIDDLSADSLLTVSDDGRNADLNLELAARRFFNTAFINKPMEGISLLSNARLENFDRLEAMIDSLSVANYLLDANGEIEATGIQAAFRDQQTQGFGKWLRNIRTTGELRLQQDLAGWSGFKDALNMNGMMDYTVSILNDPETSLRLNMLTDLRDAALAWGELFEASGVNGTWTATKTLRLTNQGRTPVSPAASQFTIDRIGFSTTMLQGEILNSTLSVRGLEEGLTLDFGSRDFLAGTARATGTISLLQGDPVINTRLEVTGLDMARLARSSYGREAQAADELNATGSFRWRLTEGANRRFLDDMTVEVKSTRIGAAAFARLLRALDADQDDPRFQNALAALRVGQPVSADFLLQGALASFGAELRLPGGFRTPLPILERQPLGDLLEVYELDEFGPLIELTRWALLLTLAPDLETFEATMDRSESQQ